MARFFTNRQVVRAHKSLWSGKPQANGQTVKRKDTSTARYSYIRRRSERVITQNTRKESPNTDKVLKEGEKISWVIDDKRGYVDKVTTDAQGVTTVTHLQ